MPACLPACLPACVMKGTFIFLPFLHIFRLFFLVNPKPLKIVFVGDGASGKSTIQIARAERRIYDEYCPQLIVEYRYAS